MNCHLDLSCISRIVPQIIYLSCIIVGKLKTKAAKCKANSPSPASNNIGANLWSWPWYRPVLGPAEAYWSDRAFVIRREGQSNECAQCKMHNQTISC